MKRLLFAGLLLSVLIAATGLRAQSGWTKVDVATTANLWGACYGGNQFVVVGTAGTILTSPDGTSWTAQTSGATGWLNGVTWNGSLYVAVGEGGTILSSPDGIAWTIRASGGERLNGIAYAAGRFVAVGEMGVVRSSTDGIQWTTATLHVPTWLHGVCYGVGEFLIGAGDGTVFSTRDGAEFRVAARYPGAVEALDYADGQIWAVGAAGLSPEFVSEYLRGVAKASTFTVLAVGNHGTVEEYGEGPTTLPESVRTVLGTENLNAIAIGPRTRIVVGNRGSLYRQSLEPQGPNVGATVEPRTQFLGGSVAISLQYVGTPPFTVQWAHDGVPIVGATGPSLVLDNLSPADAGRYTAIVSNAAGTATGEAAFIDPQPPPSLVVDPGFAVEYAGLSDPVPATDGRIVMRVASEGAPEPFRVLLQHDGTLGLNPGPYTAPPPMDARGTLVALPSHVLVVISVSSEGAAVVQRSDSGTALESVPLPIPANVSLRVAYGTPRTAFDDHGRAYVAVTSVPSHLTSAATCIFRFNADGTVDHSFEPVAFPYALDGFWFGNGGLSVDVYDTQPLLPHVKSHTFRRLTADGTPDPDFTPVSVGPAPNAPHYSPVGCFLPSGQMLLARYTPTGYEIVRYDASGALDPSFVDRVVFDATDSGIFALSSMPDGTVLASGRFTAANGVRTAGWVRLRVPTDDPGTRLVNLSIRTVAGGGDETLIAGFVVGGSSGSRSMLVRGVGPGLVPMGLAASDVVRDPRITLYRRGTMLDQNDEWDSALQPTATAVGAYPLTPGSHDAALLKTLSPGAYTVHVTTADADSRLALVELYDADAAPGSATAARLVNISGRAHVGTGNNVLVAGFVVTGRNSKRVLVRGIGPGLQAQGVGGVLADPEVLVHHAGVVVGSNDDWDASLAAAFRTVGAFALAEGSPDAALAIDLPPGVYTATVRGVHDTTGNAMVEVYELP